MYKYNVDQLATPAWIRTCTIKNVQGAKSKTYSEPGSEPIFVNFKSKGGTEAVHNGALVILDTATVTTWFNPDIKAGDRLVLDDGSEWDIKNTPENLERRNQYMQFTVQRVGGY